MTFLDYVFSLMSDGSIVMDPELKPDSIKVKNGDKFEIVITPEGTIVFKKIV